MKDNQKQRERDALVRNMMSEQIDRYPKVESHNCREKLMREYLSAELSKGKMYTMFLREWIPRVKPPSFTTYLDVFNGKNLSIHRPKIGQCSLCGNYHQGSEEVKRELQEKFDTHVGEKEKVRELKNESKKKSHVLRLIYSRSCTYQCLMPLFPLG